MGPAFIQWRPGRFLWVSGNRASKKCRDDGSQDWPRHERALPAGERTPHENEILRVLSDAAGRVRPPVRTVGHVQSKLVAGGEDFRL